MSDPSQDVESVTDLVLAGAASAEGKLALGLLGERGRAIAQYVQDIQERRQNRAARLLEGVARDVGEHRDEVWERIADDERLVGLVEEAVVGALSAREESRLQALRRAVVAGLLAEDTATVDAEVMVVRALNRLARLSWIAVR